MKNLKEKQSHLEDLHTELSCTVDALDIVSDMLGETLGNPREKDSIYSIVCHLKRVVVEMDDAIFNLDK